MEEAPDEGAGTLQVFVRPETPLINRPRLPVIVPQTGVEAAQLAEEAENPENQGGMSLPNLANAVVSSCRY